MPHTGKRSCYLKPSSLSNKLFFDNSLATIWKDGLKSKFWIKNFTTCQILNKKNTTRQILICKFYNVSDFGLKKYNALDFELKIFRHVRFWKIVCIRKITFWFILLRENYIFGIFRTFLKSMMLHWNFHYVLNFDFRKIKRVIFWKIFFHLVRFWRKNLTTCQFLY